MAINSNKYIIQNIERITAFDLTNGACDFIMDDLQEAQLSVASEIVYAEGKNGVKIGSADRNKESSFTATNGAIVDGVLAAQLGTDVELGTFIVPNYMDIMTTANGTTATTEYIAQGATGAEITWIYKRNTDGTLGAKYGIAAVASATKFAYNPSTKVITLPTDAFDSGDELVAFYDIEVANAKRIQNAEDKFSKTDKVIFDVFAKDICTEKSYYATIIFYKGKISGTFDLSFGNDPSTQNVEITALSGGCNKGSSKLLWDMIIWDADEVTDGAGMAVSDPAITLAKGASSNNIDITNAVGAVTAAVTDSSSQPYAKVTAVVSGDNDTVIVSAAADAAAGTYTVTLTDSTSGTAQTATITVTVAS